MKNTILLFILLSILSSCNREKAISEQIMKAWIAFYEEHNIDMTSEFNLFELALIEEGYLKDNSSNSYKELYRSLSEVFPPRIELPDSISLACVRLKQTKETPLLNKIKFFTEVEKLTEQDEFNQSGWKNFPFLGISNLITTETIKNEVVKTYLLLNLMVLSEDLGAELKSLLPEAPPIDDEIETIFVENIERIKFREKQFNIEEFKEFMASNNEKIETLYLSVDEKVQIGEVVKLMNILRNKGIKTRLKEKEDKN